MSDLPEGVILEHRSCPLGCHASDDFVIEGSDRLHGIGGRFRVVRCRHCGLMRTNPRPTNEAMSYYYPAEYGPYAGISPSPVPPAQDTWRRRFRQRLGLEPARLPVLTPGCLLEIGCASGAFLAEMQGKGWSVQGIEFSDVAAARARAEGFDVQTASVEGATPPAQPVDLIAAWMVLEHLHDPAGALARMRGWVKPEGWLVASVPDAAALERRVFGSRWYALQLPTHLFHYTPRTLASLLDRQGWRLVNVMWQPNAKNLLASLSYLAADLGWPWLIAVTSWLLNSRGAGRLRLALGGLLRATRQSGRIVVWARPKTLP